MASQRIRESAKRITRARGWQIVRWPVEHTLTYHLRQIFHYYGINLVLDVGANDGEYGRFLRSIGYRGWIASFEPTEGAYRRLTSKAARDARWQAHRLALGSEDGEATIHVTGNDRCSSFLEPVRRESWPLVTGWDLALSLEIDHKETVPVRRLDSVFEQVKPALAGPPRIFLKMDTQGYDLEVFRGATAVLPRVAALQSEVSVRPLYEGMPTWQESLACYHQAGFAENGFFSVSMDGETLVTLEFDCVLVRASRFVPPN